MIEKIDRQFIESRLGKLEAEDIDNIIRLLIDLRNEIYDNEEQQERMKLEAN